MKAKDKLADFKQKRSVQAAKKQQAQASTGRAGMQVRQSPTLHSSGSGEISKEVLRYYDGYITTLATVEVTNDAGVCNRYIDADMKAEI